MVKPPDPPVPLAGHVLWLGCALLDCLLLLLIALLQLLHLLLCVDEMGIKPVCHGLQGTVDSDVCGSVACQALAHAQPLL